jgi:hypothetical protein
VSKDDDTRLPNLSWAKQASDNLRRYLAKLQAHLVYLKQRGGETRTTEQLVAEVERRLAELDKLPGRARALNPAPRCAALIPSTAWAASFTPSTKPPEASATADCESAWNKGSDSILVQVQQI